jgi:hypothetical protein
VEHVELQSIQGWSLPMDGKRFAPPWWAAVPRKLPSSSMRVQHVVPSSLIAITIFITSSTSMIIVIRHVHPTHQCANMRQLMSIATYSGWKKSCTS